MRIVSAGDRSGFSGRLCNVRYVFVQRIQLVLNGLDSVRVLAVVDGVSYDGGQTKVGVAHISGKSSGPRRRRQWLPYCHVPLCAVLP